MRVIKKISFLVVLFVVTLFVHSAVAGPVELLPESSHYHGRAYYTTYTTGGVLRGRIDFAVYDTTAGNEYVNAGFTAPGAGRYIYAYQIFCDTSSTDALEYLAILEIGDNAIDDTDGIGTQDDGFGGTDANNAFFNPYPGPKQAVWEFDNGVLIAGEHSFFLVFTSEHDWKEGSFDVIPSGGDLPQPAPEPGTLALLGLGSLLTFMRRRKSV